MFCFVLNFNLYLNLEVGFLHMFCNIIRILFRVFLYLDVQWSWHEDCSRDDPPIQSADSKSIAEANLPENEIFYKFAYKHIVDVQSNLSTTATLGTPKKWRLY